MRLRQQRDIAGDTNRQSAGDRPREGHGLAVGAEEAIGAGARRCRLAAVDRVDRAGPAVMVDEEAAAAYARALRLDHGEREHHRHRCVGSASARAQHLPARFGGARVGSRHHPAIGMRGERRYQQEQDKKEANCH